MKARVAVGMSGGVDSSVTAAILVEGGYDVTGVYIEAYNEPGCRTDQDKRDALKVATKLGIQFEVLDLRKEYKSRVVEYFLSEYKAGRTPNPDVVCNSQIKFGLLLDWVRERGCSKLATGHYARIAEDGLLQQPRDMGKDQSYFLWRVSRDKLKHVMFPLGELIKVQVRAKARELGLANAEKPDSMGVCMMGELDVNEFLRGKLGEKSGEVVMRGEVVGAHKGLWFSTIGQRVGSEISLQGRTLKAMGLDTTRMPALYVVGKDKKMNQIIIGVKDDVWVSQVKLEQVEWYGEERNGLSLRVRNLGETNEVVRVTEQENIGILIETKAKIWGVAEGQSGVLYNHEGVVVGGGIIV